MSKPQRLNSVERFRKQPDRLVLEEHSHCEAPAGCGGVVLRWRNPLAALPITLHVYTPVKATLLINGIPQDVGRFDLPPGDHIAALALENVNLLAGLLMFVAQHDPKNRQRALPEGLDEAPIKIMSADDGTWKYSLEKPANDDWTSRTFDDQGWASLTTAPTPQLNHPDFGFYQSRFCTHLGAICLGIAAPQDEVHRAAWWQRLFPHREGQPRGPAQGSVWIRKAITIPYPESRVSPS
jgi:hypothetical protein